MEDKLTSDQKNDKAGQETWIVGGGAYHASDKIVQHNGCGTVNVSNHAILSLLKKKKLTLSADHQFLRRGLW